MVNTTFFSFATNQNLNMVVKDGKIVSYNVHSIAMRGKDTFQYRHPFSSAIGITRKRMADVAWTFTDSAMKKPYAFQSVVAPLKDSLPMLSFKQALNYGASAKSKTAVPVSLQKWKVQTAVGGGPVLVQDGKVQVRNNEEIKFAGKAINDLHPRTLMGYTKDGKLIVMVIEGRHPGVAEGASLLQSAQIMAALGCTEALNLDGGGSSCMLINGRQTIEPSDKGLQRPVPAVFIIRQKK
ncbi:MAG: phosphodiester glycosidase family protein [Chitinophagaceae bacterium]|nr:MAG: phosphodiester glycosidase family protein [Chitinophagaceae bacterium]